MSGGPSGGVGAGGELQRELEGMARARGEGEGLGAAPGEAGFVRGTGAREMAFASEEMDAA